MYRLLAIGGSKYWCLSKRKEELGVVMLALMYLVFFVIYFLLLIAVVRWAWRKGIQKGSKQIAVVYAAGGFFAISLPVFWNYIPVKIEYHAMCAKDAGFTEFISSEKWLAENADKIISLKGVNLDDFTKVGKTSDGFSRYITFGGLLESRSKSYIKNYLSVEIGRVELQTIDVASGEILIRYIDYSIGQRDDVRFWLVHGSCFVSNDVGSNSPSSKYFGYRYSLKDGVK